MNCLEDKVQAKKDKWENTQKEIVELQNQRLTTLEKYNIELKKDEEKREKRMKKRIDDDVIKAKKYREREERIAAFLKEGNEFQEAIEARVSDLDFTKCSEEDTIDIVHRVLRDKEYKKACDNTLKRDNTHIIVSPLKKPRQTEENSGLMLTE